MLDAETTSEYVIHTDFEQQELLRQRTLLLRVYVHCLSCARCRWVVNFSLRPLYPPRRNSDTRWIGSYIDPRDSPGESEKRKLSWLLLIWIMTHNRLVLRPSAIQLRLWIVIFNRNGRNLTCVIKVTARCTDGDVLIHICVPFKFSRMRSTWLWGNSWT